MLSAWPQTTQPHTSARSVVQLVKLFTDQCMRQQGEGRGRTNQTPHPTPCQGKKREISPTSEQQIAGTHLRVSPLHPTRMNRPTRRCRGQQEQMPGMHKGKQPPHQDGQPPSQGTGRTAPTGPGARKLGDRPAHPSHRPQPAKANHNSHGTTNMPGERPPQRGNTCPPPGKRPTTAHAVPDTAGGAGKGTGPRNCHLRQSSDK